MSCSYLSFSASIQNTKAQIKQKDEEIQDLEKQALGMSRLPQRWQRLGGLSMDVYTLQSAWRATTGFVMSITCAEYLCCALPLVSLSCQLQDSKATCTKLEEEKDRNMKYEEIWVPTVS